LYIESSLQREFPRVLKLIENMPVLTTSDCRDFAVGGGMLGFIEDDGKIVFEANPEAIEKSDVEVSSKILRLARIVRNRT
jgi:hypothetical protein